MTPAAQLEGFLAKFDPKVAALARAAVKKMRAKLKGANVLVYDNYNALAIGFGPGERASDAIFSIAVFPKYPCLCFLQNGPALPDAEKRLRGAGNVVRNAILKSAADLDDPYIEKLMREALKRAKTPLDAKAKSTLIIKSISAKQRPRRAP